MDVTDLNHYRSVSEDAPVLPGHVIDLVRAATAGDAGDRWRSALPCRRRPGRRACPGRMVITRAEPDAPIRWRCDACGDQGTISNWGGSCYDLRRRGLTAINDVHAVAVDDDTAAALRSLQLLDLGCQRLVFAMRADQHGAVLVASRDELQELLDGIAAEANHEPSRTRQRRLDAALEALGNAARGD